MKTIAFLCRPTVVFDEEQLLSLLAIFRRYNKRNDITGFMLYRKGMVFQLIEGPDENISQLWRIIGQDSCVGDLRKLVDRPASNRRFEGSPCAFKYLTDEGQYSFTDISCSDSAFTAHQRMLNRSQSEKRTIFDLLSQY